MSMAAGARAGARLLHLSPSSSQFSRSHLPSPAANLTLARAFSADHGHGPARVNLWEQPLNPGRWKEEHFVFVSLAGWFLLFYGGYKAVTRPSKPRPPNPAAKTEESKVKGASKKEEPALKVAESVPKKEEPVLKGKGGPVAKKEESVTKGKGRPVPMKEEPVPKGKFPAPKIQEKPVPKQREETLAKKKDEEKGEKKCDSKACKDKKAADRDKEKK